METPVKKKSLDWKTTTFWLIRSCGNGQNHIGAVVFACLFKCVLEYVYCLWVCISTTGQGSSRSSSFAASVTMCVLSDYATTFFTPHSSGCSLSPALMMVTTVGAVKKSAETTMKEEENPVASTSLFPWFGLNCRTRRVHVNTGSATASVTRITSSHFTTSGQIIIGPPPSSCSPHHTPSQKNKKMNQRQP